MERGRHGFPRGIGGSRVPRRSWAWIAAAPIFACLACGDPSEATGDTASSSAAIYGGAVEEGGNDAVVAVRVGVSTPFTLCTGTLVAPGLVLTAWHCVASSVSSIVSCSESGQSLDGPQLGADVSPSEVGVYTGVRPNVYGTAEARGVRIFHAQGDALCDDDVAFVALDRPLAQAPMAMRLGGGVRAGDVLRVVGYGVNDGSFGTAVRVSTPGLAVRAVGATLSASQTPLGAREFELGMSACQGDSGGPALDGNGAVVGIVSRGGACTDDFGHVYMQPAGEPAVIDAAFTFAGAQPLAETIGQAADAGGSSNDLRAGAHACSARVAPGTDDSPRGAWTLAALACVLVASRRHSRKKSSVTLSKEIAKTP